MIWLPVDLHNAGYVDGKDTFGAGASYSPAVQVSGGRVAMRGIIDVVDDSVTQGDSIGRVPPGARPAEHVVVGAMTDGLPISLLIYGGSDGGWIEALTSRTALWLSLDGVTYAATDLPPASLVWPPTLDELKLDRGITDELDDEKLEQVLSAAVHFVEKVRDGDYNFAADPLLDLPDPTPDLKLGTIRLAGRWHVRRRSPDALIQMADQGSSTVPSFDPDIDRLLGIGRFRGPVFA